MSKLKEYRERAGFTQSSLAKAANINIRTLQKFESKERNIDGTHIENLCNLAEVLNCKVYDLIEDENLAERVKKLV